MSYRTDTIIITPTLNRWLRWASLKTGLTPESIAETCLREKLLADNPEFEAVEKEYLERLAESRKWEQDKFKQDKPTTGE